MGVDKCAQKKVGINYVGEVVLQLCSKTVTGIHYVKQTLRQADTLQNQGLVDKPEQ